MEYILIGKIVNTHGIKGELKVETYTDFINERFKKNPLRILDCKFDKDLDIMKNVPRTIDYLNEESKNHFEKVYLNFHQIYYKQVFLKLMIFLRRYYQVLLYYKR